METLIELSKCILLSLFIVVIGFIAWIITLITLKHGKTKPDAKLTYLQCEGYTSTGKGKWRRVA